MSIKADTEATYYPVFLNVKGRRCAVIGGGHVAARKVKALLEAGARVTVISPEVCQELDVLAGDKRVKLIDREYQTGDLKGIFVAIAATDSSIINRQVSEDARRELALVNVADDAEKSDFIAPAVIRRGDITLAISTAGTSPALARKLRVKLEEEFGEEWSKLGRLIGEVRAEVRKQKITVDGESWQAALDLDKLLKLVREGHESKAKAALLEDLKARQKRD